ncbi:huntingtin-like [Rhincodon typus]|uniref:huntingtin-like n=1 Tax=Rhincodon typus TaxID=259920 RepID=UPI00202FD8FF|nr:huntingtin-like [Rhincodon typus]
MATMEKLMKAFESLKSFQQGPSSEEPGQKQKKESATTKKDRVTHCLTICENIVAQSLRNSPEFQKLLGIAMEMFLLCCDDAESDVRMVADECLNKIIKQALTDSNLPRLQLELYKEIKKNGPPRSLRAALWRFAELAHLVRPQKCRPYLVNLLPCLARISKRSEESVQETLATAVPKIMMALGNFANDSEIKMLLKTFIGNLKSSSPTIRRTAASSAVSICQHSRKTQYFYTWLLNVLLGFMVPVEEDRPTPLILGVMLTLRYLMPLLRQQVKDTSLRGSFGVTRKEAEISPSLDQLVQAYELTLHYTQHRDHNVVTAALEMLQQLFRTPPPELLRALTSAGSITKVSIARDDVSNRVRSGSIVELIGKMVSGEEDGLEDDPETRSEVSTATFPGSMNSEVDVPSPSGVSTLGSTNPLPETAGHDIITQQPRSQHTLQSAESVDLNSSATSDLTGLAVEGEVDEALSRSSSQISTIQSDTNVDQNDRTNQAISPLSESSQTTEGPDSAVTPSDSSELVLDGTDSQYSAMQIGQLQDEEEDTPNTPGDALLDSFATSTLAVNKSHLLSHMGHSRQSSDSSVDRFVSKDDCVESADLDTKDVGSAS